MSKFDFNDRIKVLHLINHLAVIYGLYLIFTGVLALTYLWIGLFSYVLIVLIGLNIGFHRYFCHRSFKTTRPWEYVMAFFGTICTVGPVIGWVGLHRYHHAYSDTPLDPHDPHKIGILRAWTYFWNRSKFSRRMIKMELNDPMLKFFNKHYFKTIFTYVVALAIIDPWLVIWCYAIPACGGYMMISAATVIAHMHGTQPYSNKDSSKNSWIASLLGLGEGWHNYHHWRAGDHRHGHLPWEFDPAAWVIEHIISTNKRP